MTVLESILIAITAIIIPYVVALIKGGTVSGNKARWMAIGISLAAGIMTAFVSGIPSTPAAWIFCIFAAIGAVQVAYSAFKSVGITSGWLDALSAVRQDSDDPAVIAKNQSMKDHVENRISKNE